MIFDLVKDFADVLQAMPKEHPRHRILKLLDEAIRRDVHFIDRHPTTFFQCMWNTCWWYDCPDAVGHYTMPEEGWQEVPPWERDGDKLCNRLEQWRGEKFRRIPETVWIRSLRPPRENLNSGLLAVLRGHLLGVTKIAFSPDGRNLASCSNDETVRIWDVDEGRQLLVATPPKSGGHNQAKYVGYTLNGQRLVVVYQQERAIRVWNPTSGQLIRTLTGHGHSIICGAVSRTDPRIFASGAFDRTLRIWNIVDGKCVSLYQSPYDMAVISAVDFDYNGSRIAFAESAIREHLQMVRIWDYATGEIDDCFTMPGSVRSRIMHIAFSPSGDELLMGGEDGIVRLRDIPNRREVFQFQYDYQIGGLAFQPDGRGFAVASDIAVAIWDRSNLYRPQFEFRAMRGFNDAIAFSPDGRLVASGVRDIEHRDDVVRIWDMNSHPQHLELCNPKGWITGVAFSPDPNELVTRSQGGEILSWNVYIGICRRVDEFPERSQHDVPGESPIEVASPYPPKSDDRTYEAEIRLTTSGRAVGWSPDWLGGSTGGFSGGNVVCPIRHHLSLPMWAGAWANHFYLHRLEGDIQGLE